MPRTPDLFDGIYDNQSTGCREVWAYGQRKRYAHRTCCNNEGSQFRELHHPWGYYPDLPANAAQRAA